MSFSVAIDFGSIFFAWDDNIILLFFSFSAQFLFVSAFLNFVYDYYLISICVRKDHACSVFEYNIFGGYIVEGIQCCHCFFSFPYSFLVLISSLFTNLSYYLYLMFPPPSYFSPFFASSTYFLIGTLQHPHDLFCIFHILYFLILYLERVSKAGLIIRNAKYNVLYILLFYLSRV